MRLQPVEGSLGTGSPPHGCVELFGKDFDCVQVWGLPVPRRSLPRGMRVAERPVERAIGAFLSMDLQKVK